MTVGANEDWKSFVEKAASRLNIFQPFENIRVYNAQGIEIQSLTSLQNNDVAYLSTTDDGPSLVTDPFEEKPRESQISQVTSSSFGSVDRRHVDLEKGDVSQQKEASFSSRDQRIMATIRGNQRFKIALVVGFYFFISISLVLLNKIVLNGSEYSIPAPMFIVWFQLLVALVIIWLVSFLARWIPAFALIPPLEIDLQKAKQILPLTLCFIGMIVFNNLCLLYVHVSFYQIARSLTILFNIIFTYFLLSTKTSWPAVRACLIVVFGFSLGSLGEADFTWQGVVYGVISSVFVSLYSIYVKKALPLVGDNHWKLIAYNTVIAIPLLLPVMWIGGEFEIIANHPMIYDNFYWFTMFITGVMGYLLNIAIYLQIKTTSPLTHNLSGTVKACVQTMLSIWIWGNEITFLNGVGIFLVIAGSFLYSHVRNQEMNLKEKDKSRDDDRHSSSHSHSSSSSSSSTASSHSPHHRATKF
eukprot:TRINITY_DN1185_c0_g5_i1.p1 TRINITY_DN1185_c0_g5~~TRINITY_DN1185_c0_g5_i1.p1  ORF type:complete len:505 (-),score=121.84 TRINITY_DN1185_c0_g5_i1:44-1453(-)